MKIIVTVLFALLALLMVSGQATAGDYQFNVKVKNKDIHQIYIKEVNWYAKGSSAKKWCGSSSLWYGTGESVKIACGTVGNWEKWQRQIRVTFKCAIDPNISPNEKINLSTITVSFPRNKKYFARDHAVKNNDTYTVKIKKTDC